MSLASQFFIDPWILRSLSLDRRKKERFQETTLWRASSSVWSTLWTLRWPLSEYLPDLLSGTWATFSIKAPSPPFLRDQRIKALRTLRPPLASPEFACKLSFQQDRDVTLFRSSQDFHTGSIARRSNEKVLNSFEGDLTKLPFINKSKEKTKVSFQASEPFAEYLHAPFLGISKMHKGDNIQAISSTQLGAKGKGGQRPT